MRTTMASTAVEDYVRALYLLQESRPGAAVTTGQLAERLHVTPASASAMLKHLADMGLVEHTDYHGGRLTEQGRRLALELTRHHRLVEQFLAEVLEIPWELVHDEADRLEHAISETVEASIASRLGDPQRDPHGDPIPTAQLAVNEPPTLPLDQLAIGATGRFVRVRDPQPAMLRYLSEAGIALGQRLAVLERQPFGGATTVQAENGVHTIGKQLAELMRVEVEE
jgi:DtxR family Mn-dependent transcriptional regulator